ncbi:MULTISPECIES: DUF6318 family protein [unclassified Modestobacter]|uniref:DUF6318 family protein n=1 Tax=unclassified Modestobacter TaxID=2643866 RepID=UPI0022AA4E6D|nr:MULTISPECIES: DUF6318 family protein [unclassified Modestobacter]MCZ2825544.1 DUF6318 family protein [Modestobacter sp. VKM Ac-2981]MCZ2853391.1 DUF6318 family protein [Modestobacter sp. VKM Ac-2982]
MAIAVLGACSRGEAANETLPDASSSVTAAHPIELGPADLPLPAVAQERTAEGFSAFAEYYISLINRLQNDLDSTHLRQFSRNCDTCDRLAADADSDSLAGYRYDGGELTIAAIAPVALTDEQAEIAFTIDQAAYSVIDASGRPVEGLSAAQMTGLPAGMIGVWTGDHWVVTNLSFG